MLPAIFTYTFAVMEIDGSRLRDFGLTRDGKKLDPSTPKMIAGDTLQVEIKWPGLPGGIPPAELAGHFMISAAPQPPLQPGQPIPAAQLMPSPFRTGTRYLCYQKQTGTAKNHGDEIGYTFPGLVCADGANAQYELTFTLECEKPGPYAGRQWSIDPEFDTGN